MIENWMQQNNLRLQFTTEKETIDTLKLQNAIYKELLVTN